MSIFNNTEENYWRNLATKTVLVCITSSHHRVVPATQRGQNVSLRCRKAMDVWIGDCQVRLPYLQNRRGHQARTGLPAHALPALLQC